MAKMPMSAIFGFFFLPFLSPLQAIKISKLFFSCRGGSRFQFGGSYVNID